MDKETREQKNFHLATVGGAGLLLTGACVVIGIWLIATGDCLPGAVVTLASAIMLYTSFSAYGRIRATPPEYGDYNNRKEKVTDGISEEIS